MRAAFAVLATAAVAAAIAAPAWTQHWHEPSPAAAKFSPKLPAPPAAPVAAAAPVSTPPPAVAPAPVAAAPEPAPAPVPAPAQPKTAAAPPAAPAAPASAATPAASTPAPEPASAAESDASAAQAPGPAAPAHPVPRIEAKTIFGALGTPAPLPARAIGFYSHGCLAGAEPLPIDGPLWQAMRLSRNRNWGHPALIKLVERLAADAKQNDDWPGLLVGDMSQPRGGPMLSGHASHQVGLDADVWLTPMPARRLSEKEREEIAATSMLGPDGIHVDPGIFSGPHARLILRAASYPEVERVFVHPGIKKALCELAGAPTAALTKIRPMWGHYYHMHIRIGCPPDSVGCQSQPPVPANDGCGKEVDDWIALLSRPAKPVDPGPATAAKPAPVKPGLSLDQLPAECRMVINAGAPGSIAEERARAKAARLH